MLVQHTWGSLSVSQYLENTMYTFSRIITSYLRQDLKDVCHDMMFTWSSNKPWGSIIEVSVVIIKETEGDLKNTLIKIEIKTIFSD